MAQPGLFTRIFDRKPRLDHPVVSKRLEALATLGDSQEDIFQKIAHQDKDLEVRLAAVQRITSPDRLAHFLEDNSLVENVAERICAAIDLDHELMQHDRIRDIMLSRISDGKQLGCFAKQLKSTEEAAAAIFSGSTAEIRQAAIMELSSTEVLNLCERISRSKDKVLNRFIRDRLAQRKKLASQQDELLARVEQLIDSAARAPTHASNYASLRDAQEKRWDDLLEEIGSLNTQLKNLGVEGLDLGMLRVRFPKRSTHQQADVTDGQAFSQILQGLRDADASVEVIEQAEQNWLENLKSEPAPLELSNEFFELIHEKREFIKQHQARDKLSKQYESIATQKPELPDLNSKGCWPKVWAAKQESKNLLRQCTRFLKNSDFRTLDPKTRNEWSEAIQGMVQHCEQLVNQTDELMEATNQEIATQIDQLKEKVSAGATKEASRLERSTRNLINRLPDQARRRPIDMLAPVSAELHNLLNWKKFVTEPKREELLQQIKNLKDNPLEPHQQHEQIKSLRTAWNSLGPPISSDEIDLQKKYDDAADAAWQVCRTWFEEQNEVRNRNTELKEDIAKELEKVLESTDWTNADWDGISKQLHSRRAQYEEIHNVQRSRIRKINKRFYNAHAAVRKKMIEHREEVGKLKRQLIERAKEIAANESTDQKEQISAIKEIQAEWRIVGVTFHKDEESLWHEFREVCNEIFENRRQAYEKRKEDIDTNIEEASKMVDRLLRRTKNDPQKIQASEYNEVAEHIAELYLPKRIQQTLDKKLDQINGLLAGRKEAVRQLAVRDRYVMLLHADAELAGYEATNEPIPESWFDTVDSDSVLFETRIAIEDDAQLQELTDVVLKAEIKAEINPKDESEQQRRLHLKVNELSETVGRSAATPAEVVEKLISEWVGIAYGQLELRERFNQSMQILLDRIVD